MKKRSKTEVEIRNILSGILLHSLRDGTMANILHLIIKYCDIAGHSSGNTIDLKDLLKNKANFHLPEFNWKDASKDVHLKRLFVFSPGYFISLKTRYVKSRRFICRKTKDYLKFLSHVKSGTERFEDKLQDKVKVGVMLYNNGFFFESHEFLEEIWLNEKGREKSFLKGLIHASVAFYHLEYENIKGTVNYLKRSYSRLKEFEPGFLGIDVKNFLSGIEKAIKFLEQSKPIYSKDAIPKIKLIDQ